MQKKIQLSLFSMISDNNIFCEVKKAYAKDMVRGFIKLNGMTVGAVANSSKVYNEEAEVDRNHGCSTFCKRS